MSYKIKVEVSNVDGQFHVWRTANTYFRRKYLIPTVKYGGFVVCGEMEAKVELLRQKTEPSMWHKTGPSFWKGQNPFPNVLVGLTQSKSLQPKEQLLASRTHLLFLQH